MKKLSSWYAFMRFQESWYSYMGFLDEANCACRCFSSQQERLPQGLETGEKKVRVRFMKVFQPLYVWTIISCLIYSLIRPKKFSRRAT